MSAIGRIIIVLNLLLSAAFMGFGANALSTSENYSAQLATAKSDAASALAEKDDEISKLQTQANTLNDEKRDFREARDASDKKGGAMQTALDTERARNDQMENQLTQIAATLGDYNDSIGQLTSEKDQAVEARHEAEGERDDANDKALAAELEGRRAAERAEKAEAQVAQLKGALENSQKALESAQQRFAQLANNTGTDPGSVMATPDIDAKVLGIESDLSPALVMLNVGKDQGVQRGFVFDLYRGGQYKGQCRIEDVEAGYSSAVVVRTQPGTSIVQGDNASTNLR